MARTTAVLSDHNRPIYVGEGAVAQQGNRKLYECNDCHREVVWLESKRTGKMYLADVYKGNVARYYVSKPHNCRPHVEAAPEPSYKEQAQQELVARARRGDITREQMIAGLDALDSVFATGLGD